LNWNLWPSLAISGGLWPSGCWLVGHSPLGGHSAFGPSSPAENASWNSVGRLSNVNWMPMITLNGISCSLEGAIFAKKYQKDPKGPMSYVGSLNQAAVQKACRNENTLACSSNVLDYSSIF